LLKYIKFKKSDVVQQQPDIVIFMGGTNDLWWDLELNLIQANLSAMIYAQYS